MAVSDDFRDFVLEQLAPAGRVTPRAMFGGVGLYLDGLFFALIDDDTLYFKADESTRAALREGGVEAVLSVPGPPGQADGLLAGAGRGARGSGRARRLGARGDGRCAREAERTFGAAPRAGTAQQGAAMSARPEDLALRLRRDWEPRLREFARAQPGADPGHGPCTSSASSRRR